MHKEAQALGGSGEAATCWSQHCMRKSCTVISRALQAGSASIVEGAGAEERLISRILAKRNDRCDLFLSVEYFEC